MTFIKAYISHEVESLDMVSKSTITSTREVILLMQESSSFYKSLLGCMLSEQATTYPGALQVSPEKQNFDPVL